MFIYFIYIQAKFVAYLSKEERGQRTKNKYPYKQTNKVKRSCRCEPSGKVRVGPINTRELNTGVRDEDNRLQLFVGDFFCLESLIWKKIFELLQNY